MTTPRHRSRLALLRLLHELAALTDGDTIPVPRALLDAITTALGPFQASPCRTCGTPIPGRTSRAFCCDACRMVAYRARQAQAHQLAQRGLPLDVIATQVETEVATLQGWLAKPPPAPTGRRRGRPRKERPFSI